MKLYKTIEGCTGTAVTEYEEFFEIYNWSFVVITTKKEMIRKDINNLMLRTEGETNNLIKKQVITRNQVKNKKRELSHLLR